MTKDESINDWDSASPNANKPSAEASTPKSKNLNNTPRNCFLNTEIFMAKDDIQDKHLRFILG